MNRENYSKIRLLDFYNVMRHSPLDSFVIYYDNDASFAIMHGETLEEYADRFENAYVTEVNPESMYTNDEFYEWLRVVAKCPNPLTPYPFLRERFD